MTKIETNTIKPELSFTENDQNYLIFTKEEETKLDSKIEEIENYLNKNAGPKKDEQEKDEYYKQAQNLWHGFVNGLKDAKYQFYLNKAEHKFLTELILTKIEYDVNTVFFAIELTNMLGGLKDAKYTNEKDLLSFPVNATEITYIYHLISKHKVKGLTKDAYTFSKVLIRIGSISKVFNYYETASKNLSKDIQDWVLTFDEGVSIEKKSKKSVESTVLQPQK